MKQFSKFKDAGRLERDYAIAESSSSKNKTKTVYSRIDVDAKSFPGLHEKEIGSESVILVKVRKASESIPSQYSADKDNSITLEIIAISEEKDKDDYEELVRGEMKNKSMHG